jgi:hypothetical protein
VGRDGKNGICGRCWRLAAPLMPFAGVNLRQEDIASFLAACHQASVDPSSLPVLYCLHDDTEASTDASIQAALDAKLWVRIWRCMVNDSRLAPTRIPATDIKGAPSIIQGWNEADDSSAYPNLPGWVDGWWQWTYSLNRGLEIIYGAPNVDGFLLENTALEASLDLVGRHIGSTFTPPAATIQGKPAWVTEIDIDPTRFTWGDQASMTAAYAELIGCMERCLQAGVPAFAWGMLPYFPDACLDPTTIAAIAALNTKYAGATNVATPSETDEQAQRDQEEAQFQHLAEAVYAMLQSRTDDAKTQINALDPAHFTF